VPFTTDTLAANDNIAIGIRGFFWNGGLPVGEKKLW
jgi:hypothetical protein